MIIDGFTIEVKQLQNFIWEITVITPEPDKNKFIGQIQCQYLTPEAAYEQVWKNPTARKQFFLELETQISIDEPKNLV